MGFFTWLAIDNYEALTGSTSPVVNHLWLLVPVVALVGATVTRGIALQSTVAQQPKEHA